GVRRAARPPHGGPEDRSRVHEPLPERRLLGRREEARRDPAAGDAEARLRRARRDRLGARHRRAARRRRWRERATRPGPRRSDHHALHAHPELRAAGLRPHHAERPHRPGGRSGAGRSPRGEGLRLGPRGGGRSHRVMPPSFVDDRRRAALDVYEREPVPTWRRSGFWTTTLRHLRLDELEPRHYDRASQRPEIIAGDDLAAVIVQRGASVVYTEVNDERITVKPLEDAAVEDHEIVERFWMTRVSHEEGKFPAATAAFWTGGAFVHVPRGVRIEKPIQIVWLIDEPGTAQYASTLAVVEENAECEIREYCLGAGFEGQAHLDLFTTDLHEQGDTTGDTVWKGALTGESRASYEGLIHIVKGAQNTDTYLQTHSMLLSPRAKGDAIPSLIVETDNVKASHGGTVGEVDEDQV